MATKNKPVTVLERRSLGNQIGSEDEEEPPGKPATNKYKFFGHIPDSTWNDWKWHFRNRITTIEQLNEYIPLSTEEQAQLGLVIRRYPL